MKYIARIVISFFLILACSCSSGFDSKKAGQLLEKEQLSTEDYDEMIAIFENGIDDAIKFSQENTAELTSGQKEEMMLVFAIGVRLSKDDIRLTDAQRQEFERIYLKVKEQDPQTK